MEKNSLLHTNVNIIWCFPQNFVGKEYNDMADKLAKEAVGIYS